MDHMGGMVVALTVRSACPFYPPSPLPQYRWSGAVRSSNAVLGEGKTSYCTWGRELIKQYIEDAIEVVRKSLASGEWDK